jgi:3-hydroxybutyryl-CoA dehydrogenase
MEIKKIGVVGCGVTGSAFAQVFAQSDYEVVVSEVNEELLNKGLTLINSRLTENVREGKLSQQEKVFILARIEGTTKVQNFHDCDLVIEAVVEKMDAKKNVFAELDKICSQKTIFATNTSVLPILDMAMVTKRPDKVMGFHTNLLVGRIVEIIKTIATSNETIEIGKSLAKSVGKTYVIAKDTPGFIISRLTASFFCNAIRMLESGIATKEDIDTAMTAAIGLPFGPFAMMDLAGLDTILLGTTAVYEELKEPQYAPPSLLKQMVTAGRLGRKTGKGFYEYGKSGGIF